MGFKFKVLQCLVPKSSPKCKVRKELFLWNNLLEIDKSFEMVSTVNPEAALLPRQARKTLFGE